MKKRLKIGLFLDSFYPHTDGVVVVVDNLARRLAKDNDVTVIVPETDNTIDDKKYPYKIIRIKSHKFLNTEYQFSFKPSKLSKKYKEIKNENFDIVHIHSPFMIGRIGLTIAKDLNIPSIITMHTQFDYEIRKIFKKEFIVKTIVKNIMNVYNKCDASISVNNRTGDTYKKNGYKYEPHTIYNGTDIQEVKNKKKAIKDVNELYNLDKDENILLFVGRINEVKNIFFILDSLKLLKENDFNFKMIYVGFGPDEQRLKDKIKEYNMEDDVILTGKITDRQLLSSIYYRADLFLFPSVFDACSLVQIEAAINETPGLFIESSATAETIIDNVNGYLCKEDRNEYKERIKEILNDKKGLKKVSKKAKKTLSRNFDDVTKETYEFYLKQIELKHLENEN
jgi:glycosyltransferase involved in cell wall biosynthesis